MRVALVPVAAVRAQGFDVRVAALRAVAHLSYAMFSGGGLGWAETAMKRGEFAVPAAPPGTQPDLTGLSVPGSRKYRPRAGSSSRAGGAGARAPIRSPFVT